MKIVTIPVVIGTLCMIKKGTEKHLEQIPGNPNLAEMQKITFAGTDNVECICTEQKLANYTPYL